MTCRIFEDINLNSTLSFKYEFDCKVHVMNDLLMYGCILE